MSFDVEHGPPLEIVRWAIARYAPRIVLACSFGGPTGMMLLDLVMQVDRTVPVCYLDTDLLFPQTHALVEAAARRYDIQPRPVRPELTLEAQADRHGAELWQHDPDRCCMLRKVEPWREALRDADAWMAGLRRDQAATRADVSVVAWDSQFGRVKVNPLAHVSEAEVWRYLREHGVPYNALHDDGYPSIGCRPCTQRGVARSGRWSGFEKLECGLHPRGERR